MQSRADLVQVVAGAHAELPVVSVDHVRHVVELRGVSLGLGGLATIGSVIWRGCSDVVAIKALRGLKAHVVVAWLVIFAEAELGGRRKESAAAGLVNEQAKEKLKKSEPKRSCDDLLPSEWSCATFLSNY